MTSSIPNNWKIPTTPFIITHKSPNKRPKFINNSKDSLCMISLMINKCIKLQLWTQCIRHIIRELDSNQICNNLWHSKLLDSQDFKSKFIMALNKYNTLPHKLLIPCMFHNNLPKWWLINSYINYKTSMVNRPCRTLPLLVFPTKVISSLSKDYRLSNN